MALEIDFVSKGHATLLDATSTEVTLLTDFSAPPGCPLQGTLLPSHLAVTVKVRGCQQSPEGFRIKGRWVNLSCEARIRVTATPQE